MSDQVLVFSHDGKRLLGEIDTAITRSWEESGMGQASLSIGTRATRISERLLRPHNLVTVMNSDGIPPWGGMIGLPVSNDNGVASIQITTGESLLSKRTTGPRDDFMGSFEETFNRLFEIANEGEPLPITPIKYTFAGRGMNVGKVWHMANCYDAFSELLDDVFCAARFKPYITAENTLTFLPGIISKLRAQPSGIYLMQGRNLTNCKYSISTDDVWANTIYVYGEAGNWRHIVPTVYHNDASVARYGMIEANAPDSGTNDRLLTLKSKLYARMNSFPLLKVNGYITRPPYPQIGTMVFVELTETNHLTARLPSPLKMRVSSLAYTPAERMMVVELKELPDVTKTGTAID